MVRLRGLLTSAFEVNCPIENKSTTINKRTFNLLIDIGISIDLRQRYIK